MFIVTSIKKDEAAGELKLLYKMIEKNLGFVPPHLELFGTIDMKALKEFVEYNRYFIAHKKIDNALLPFMRLYIAHKENRWYCKMFNTKLLLKMGVEKNVVKNIVNEMQNIPFDNRQKTLALKVLQALYHTKKFNSEDLQELYKLGFDNKDFFDLLSYCSNFTAKSKMIEVYLR